MTTPPFGEQALDLNSFKQVRGRLKALPKSAGSPLFSAQSNPCSKVAYTGMAYSALPQLWSTEELVQQEREETVRQRSETSSAAAGPFLNTTGCVLFSGCEPLRYTQDTCFHIILQKSLLYPAAHSVQFSSVQSPSRVRLFATPWIAACLPVRHQLPEFTQTHVHRVSDAIQPSHPLSSPSSPAPNPSEYQSLFQWVNSSHEV